MPVLGIRNKSCFRYSLSQTINIIILCSTNIDWPRAPGGATRRYFSLLQHWKPCTASHGDTGASFSLAAAPTLSSLVQMLLNSPHLYGGIYFNLTQYQYKFDNFSTLLLTICLSYKAYKASRDCACFISLGLEGLKLSDLNGHLGPVNWVHQEYETEPIGL